MESTQGESTFSNALEQGRIRQAELDRQTAEAAGQMQAEASRARLMASQSIVDFRNQMKSTDQLPVELSIRPKTRFRGLVEDKPMWPEGIVDHLKIVAERRDRHSGLCRLDLVGRGWVIDWSAHYDEDYEGRSVRINNYAFARLLLADGSGVLTFSGLAWRAGGTNFSGDAPSEYRAGLGLDYWARYDRWDGMEFETIDDFCDRINTSYSYNMFLEKLVKVSLRLG